MSFKVSDTFQSLNGQINKSTQIVLKIEGSQYIYGSSDVYEVAKWDDPRIQWDNQIGVTWDGKIPKVNSKPYIMFGRDGKTTKSLSQQLIVEKGGAGSISTFNVELVDKNREVAKDLSFDQIGDPLGAKAEVWVGLVGGIFPDDFIPVLRGYIDDLKYNLGSIEVSVSSSDNLARQSSYEQYLAITTAPIDNSQTTIPVDITDNVFLPVDILSSYVRIDDEILEITGKTSTDLLVNRGALGTFPSSHDDESDVTGRYYLEGLPIDVALKLLLSKEGNEFQERDITISGVNRLTVSELLEGAVICKSYNIERELGAVVGDFIEIPSPSINAGTYTITGFQEVSSSKSIIFVNAPLIEESGLDIKLKVKSQYNVLPDGAGLDVDYVDTAAFLDVADLYSASFLSANTPMLETIENTRDWIIETIFRPQNIYSIPRKGKTSCKYLAPPFSSEDLAILNTKTIDKITKVQVRRSTHKYLYNTLLYRYRPEPLEDSKLFSKLLVTSATSFNRIDVGRKRLEIEAPGFPDTPEVTQVLTNLATRQLNRYKFGARYISNLNTTFQVGANLEVGDIVFFGGEDTQMTNIETGERDFPAAQYEITNKTVDLAAGGVKLQLLETGFGIDGLVGVFSPGSAVIGGTTTKLLIDKIWGSDQYANERDKWSKWIGLKLRVRSEDYSFDEVVTFTGLDPATTNGLLVDTLSSAPSGEMYVELAPYTSYTTEELEEILKLTYTFTMPSTLLTGVVNQSIVEVEDAGNLTVGMSINIHAEDYSADSQQVIIDDITANTLTFNEDLNIAPMIGDRLEVYSYVDAKGYRFL